MKKIREWFEDVFWHISTLAMGVVFAVFFWVNTKFTGRKF